METSLDTLLCELSAAVVDLDSAQTQCRDRRRTASWTIQQIVEHLLLTYDSTVQLLEGRLARGSATRKPATLKQRAAQFAVNTCGYFPHGRQAPESVAPAAGTQPKSGRQLMNELAASTRAMDAAGEACLGALGRGRTVTHLVLGPMSIAQWNKFHLVHARHHLKQIRAIRLSAALS